LGSGGWLPNDRLARRLAASDATATRDPNPHGSEVPSRVRHGESGSSRSRIAPESSWTVDPARPLPINTTGAGRGPRSATRAAFGKGSKNCRACIETRACGARGMNCALSPLERDRKTHKRKNSEDPQNRRISSARGVAAAH